MRWKQKEMQREIPHRHRCKGVAVGSISVAYCRCDRQQFDSVKSRLKWCRLLAKTWRKCVRSRNAVSFKKILINIFHLICIDLRKVESHRFQRFLIKRLIILCPLNISSHQTSPDELYCDIRLDNQHSWWDNTLSLCVIVARDSLIVYRCFLSQQVFRICYYCVQNVSRY